MMLNSETSMPRTKHVPSPTQRLAATLYARAAWALPRMPAERAQPCVALLEAFIAKPTPSAFMRAHHLMAVTLSEHLSQTVFGSNQTRSFEDGLAALNNVAVVPESDMACLERDLPVDSLTGSRLADLATLLQVWRELAGRADEELDRMRALRASARPSRRARE
ncbi:MAG: hypothetical protein SF187_15290 [Deltaproteobacteria bacterium]|nr:hypothetical protein [Deltaproteobacteria bacterium]